MSTPDEAQAVVAQTLADGLDVTGTVSAGVYGDPAGASAPPAAMDLSKAAPTSADIDALKERLAAMEAAQAAAAAPAPVEPVDTRPQLSGAPGWLQDAFNGIHERLLAVEEKLGL